LFINRIAKPKLQHWDQHFASPGEQELAMAQNRKVGWPEWVKADGTLRDGIQAVSIEA